MAEVPFLHHPSPHFSHAQLRGGIELISGRTAVVYLRQRGSGEFFGLSDAPTLSPAWLLPMAPPSDDPDEEGRCGFLSDAAVVNSAGRGMQPR
ncbi:MAG: hypothetical protein P4L26_02735, partial [Terracidiphilus sp.]|nr:hypothetical protein [Terracidiphilus sp.]